MNAFHNIWRTLNTTGWPGWLACLVLASLLAASAQAQGIDSFNPNANGRVRAIVVQSDGRILIGGNFTSVGGTARNRIARLNADGSVDLSFNPGTGANGEVLCLALQFDGRVLVGGSFTSLGGSTRNNLGRLAASGALDNSFNPGANGGVRDIALEANGNILVAGAFTTLAGTNCNYIGRVSATGLIDGVFNPGADAQVNTVLVQPNGRIVLGGFFTTLGGFVQSNIGQVFGNGIRDSSFDAVANGPVWKLMRDRDRIIAGGAFTTMDGVQRTNIARLWDGGYLDSSFNSAANSTVNSLAGQLDGKFVIGGNFTTVRGQTNRYIARLNEDSSLDNTLPNVGANDTLYSLALQSDGKMLVGGNFITLGGQTRNYIGRFGQAIPRPANDNFTSRTPLVLTGNLLSLVSSNLAATSEPGESNFLGNASGGRSVWYSYTPTSQGLLRVIVSPPCCDPAGTVLYQEDYSAVLARGNSASNLTGIVLPRIVDNGGLNRMARAIYADLLPGQDYVFAVDGAYNEGVTSGGEFGLDVRFIPSPGNDSFEQRSNILGGNLSVPANFLAASRQPGEPSHGGGNGSLWWTWTAPFNGLATLRGTQPGDFIPYLAVYQGNQVAGLSAVTSASEIIGHTRQLRFQAVRGQTYALASSGAKYDPIAFPHINDDRYGNGRFEFNFATLAIRVSNLVTARNVTNGIDFSVSARVEHLGALVTGPLRFRLVAKQGLGIVETFSLPQLTEVELGGFPSPPASPGLGGAVAVSGVCPAPIQESRTEGIGWEVYCFLEEQVGTNWFLCDKLMVLQGVWPEVGGFGGPGGGVIRLDPGTGNNTYDELLSVQILGPSPLNEGARTSYVGRVTFAVAPAYDFTNTLWQATRFAITNGFFRTGAVTSDTPVTLTAQYGFAGLDYSATKIVTVLNLPSPSLTFSSAIPRRPFKLSLSGVRERQHVIEATTNLVPPLIWIPLATNKVTNISGLSGSWDFTDLASTNLGRRFYRAREME